MFSDDGPLHGMRFVELGRMRATYATLAQWAGLDSRLINQIQGRTAGSDVLESNYLNPYSDTFEAANRTVSCKMEAL